MSNFALSRRAEEDIDGILDFIVEDDPHGALGLYEDLLRLFERLGKHPKIGRERNAIARGVRSIPTGRYVLYFEPENPVEIIRILHSAMELEDIW